MKNTYLLQLPQQTLECKLLYSARKTLAIEIKLNAEIIIRAPKKVKDAQIINFVESKKDWIVEKRQIAVQRKLERKPGFHFQNGKSYSCLGRQLMILGPEDVLTEQQKKAAAEAIVLRLKTNDPEKVHLTAVKWMRQLALRELSQSAATYATLMQVRYQKITIKAQKTRWGSCSNKGNLNFNWKLLLMPPELAEYVVVHELAHLKVLNHSPRFWAEVAAVFPDYAERKKKLKKLGLDLLS